MVFSPKAPHAVRTTQKVRTAILPPRDRFQSVIRSIRFLDGAAVEAVKQWRYSPLLINGIPTPFVLTVTLSFKFRN